MAQADEARDDDAPADPRASRAARLSHSRPVAAVQRHYSGSLAQDVTRRLTALDFVNNATLLGAGLLASLLPLLILLSAFANSRVDESISLRLGLDDRAEAILAHLFHSSAASLSVATVTSLVVVAAGSIAVASSLQQIYGKVFGVVNRGMRELPRLITWVAALCAVIVVESQLGRPVRDVAGGRGLEQVLTIALFTPFFWWSMHFLLDGRVDWRRLLPAAISTGVLLGVVGWISELYFSSSIIVDSRTFGAIGAVFSLLTWLIAISVVIILGPLLGASWYERRHGLT
jgi:membrane protein